MMVAQYWTWLAKERDMPLVICIALGSKYGNRVLIGQLATYLDIASRRRKRCSGSSRKTRRMQDISLLEKYTAGYGVRIGEVLVEENMPGFFIEMWQMRRSFMLYRSACPPGKCQKCLIGAVEGMSLSLFSS